MHGRERSWWPLLHGWQEYAGRPLQLCPSSPLHPGQPQVCSHGFRLPDSGSLSSLPPKCPCSCYSISGADPPLWLTGLAPGTSDGPLLPASPPWLQPWLWSHSEPNALSSKAEPALLPPTPSLETQSGSSPGLPIYLGEEGKYRWGNEASEGAEYTVTTWSPRPGSPRWKCRLAVCSECDPRQVSQPFKVSISRL